MSTLAPVARLAPARLAAATPNLVHRAAVTLGLPLWQEAKAFVQGWRSHRDSLWRDPLLDAGGLPVLLVGGLASTDRMLFPLHERLSRFNCRCRAAPVGYGVGCGEQGARDVEAALERLTDATGQPAVVIAHSRGGQFARAVAVRRPELHRGLITLGSPLRRLLAVHPLLLAQVAVLGLAGSLGVPGLMKAGCLWGECCARFRADLRRPFPAEVPFLSVYSPQDQVVDWRSTLDPAARHRPVPTTHSGLLRSEESLSAITEEIGTRLHEPLATEPTAAARTSPAA